MGQNEDAFQTFNLKTMSGVYPGSRTAVMQRIRLLPLTGDERLPRWARLLWYKDPPSCVLHLQEETPEKWQETPLLRMEDPHAQTFGAIFRKELAAVGWSPFTCGNCIHWQPLHDTTNEDGIALGRCGWSDVASSAVTMPEPLRYQSVLSLGCPAWAVAVEDRPPIPALPRAEARTFSTQTSLWQQLWVRLGQERPEPKRPSWGEGIIERSGVGAGTEPCFACQGRIANLGALIVATDEDDKRTFSVWRCRRCQSFYLNDWIDRWERLDSLETEESYYRLSPVEAVELLALFDGVIGGEHPAGRRDRMEQRAWLEGFIRNRPRLSHQIRQGR
ncbi:MAG: hypothetical protein KF893_17050 [Caldilineaceae bacterium]|nr:hypothetical protein [Caldilineaceae bacterium]